MDKEKNKEEFEELLRSTNREGIDYVIGDLEEDGFFEAPASAGHHLNVEGGLCQHSLNVWHAALMIWEGMKKLDPASMNEVKRESVIIASLLHDVCKTDIYRRAVKRRKNKATGMWEDVDGYDISYKKFPVGHGEKSVIQLLLSGLALQDDEMLAIRWHMGAYDTAARTDLRDLSAAMDATPWVWRLHEADMCAAHIDERGTDE